MVNDEVVVLVEIVPARADELGRISTLRTSDNRVDAPHTGVHPDLGFEVVSREEVWNAAVGGGFPAI
jgi:hypothetical protein